uniref:Uncharacterized protein n=1 Tax=Arundo donax TaxID=35708 RepID=A0A0A8ZSZ0_ARUDO
MYCAWGPTPLWPRERAHGAGDAGSDGDCAASVGVRVGTPQHR